MKKIYQTAGFTLTEMTMALAIAMILLLIVYNFYNLAQKSYVLAQAKAELTQNGRIVLDRWSRDLRQTPAIITPLPADNADPTNLPQEIFFQDGHNQNQIIYIRYYVNSSTSEMIREIKAYYYPDNPSVYAAYNESINGQPPSEVVLESGVIGENIQKVEFWGNAAISINLYLINDWQSRRMFTSIKPRNN